MFDEVDESLRSLLIGDVPLDATEVDISFDRPSREWSSRLARPTLNVFLFDIRERVDFRDDSLRVRELGNGTVTRGRPPRRIDLSYLVTAWTRETDDEHRILARVLAALYRNQKIRDEYLQGALKDAELPVLLRAPAPDHLQKSVDFWGVMDNELRVGLTWVVTAPLDAFAPITGPVVLTKEILVGPSALPERRATFQVAGMAHRAGHPADPVAGVAVEVRGTTLTAMSDGQGRFAISDIPGGDHVFRVQPPGSEPFELAVAVPSPSYDLAIPENSGKATRPARTTRPASGDPS